MNNILDVAIVMGSDSDLNVMKIAGETLDVFDVKYELTIISAHRTPERLFELFWYQSVYYLSCYRRGTPSTAVLSK